MTINKVNIRPGVSVLAVLRHLNYKPWFALGEFVDNSVESFMQNRDALSTVKGAAEKLRVDIDIDPGLPARISIRDNAGGIPLAEFPRAFRPATPPPDRSGLAEFGMGMKSAACWFAPRWSVRTSTLNESIARTVDFDIDNIINDDINELDIHADAEAADAHYTEVVLRDIFNVPIKRTVAKLKEHLTDIYRVFIREDYLELCFNGEILSYSEPAILNAPYFRNPEDPSIEWRKEINFDLGNGLSVHGFAAIREKGNTARAGFSLFRRGRVIQGSGDEGYRPAHIFGRSNSYRYQRLFGELHLDGFDVSHTKDGFRWDENEQPFLELLYEHLDSDDMPLLRQAEGYRARAPRDQLVASAKSAVDNTTRAMEDHLPGALPDIADADPFDTPSDEPPGQPTLADRRFDIMFRNKTWSIHVKITNDPAESEWLVLSDTGLTIDDPRKIDIRLSMVHPFMIRFAQSEPENLEALLRVAAAITIAEVLARDSGIRSAGTVRRNVNDILRKALSEA